ncbi:MAG: trypsin-like peptidase domain-containing protein [Gemmatimonadales bacterium]
MRTRLNLLLTAAVAFAIGIAATAAFDLTPAGLARAANDPLVLDVREPPARSADSGTLTGFADIASQITPAVVTIEVEREVDTSRFRFPIPTEEHQLLPGSGSGFIITDDGYIVTNNHVVESAQSIQVLLADGRRFDDVKLIGRDPTTDVALLKIDAPNLVHAPLGSSEAAKVGDWVLAIGSPGFSGGPSPLLTTVTAGIISAKGRSINILNRQFAGGPSPAIEDFIQTDAAINPGNSGGPLVNARGEVIGINSAIASTTGNYQGYGFAVPIDLVREVVDDLVEFGTVHRAVLGITVTDVDDADARFYGLDRVGGALVRGVNEDSPAADAGLEPGDVIVKVAGREVNSVSDLQREVRAYDPGETVTVDFVTRDGQRETKRVKLISAGTPEEVTASKGAENSTVNESDPLGIRVENLDGEARRSLDLPRSVDGVVITDYSANGPLGRRAPRIGITSMDDVRGLVITEVNRKKVESVDDYESAMKGVKPGDVVGLMIYNPYQDPSQQSPLVPLTVPIPSH